MNKLDLIKLRKMFENMVMGQSITYVTTDATFVITKHPLDSKRNGREYNRIILDEAPITSLSK